MCTRARCIEIEIERARDTYIYICRSRDRYIDIEIEKIEVFEETLDGGSARLQGSFSFELVHFSLRAKTMWR